MNQKKTIDRDFINRMRSGSIGVDEARTRLELDKVTSSKKVEADAPRLRSDMRAGKDYETR